METAITATRDEEQRREHEVHQIRPFSSVNSSEGRQRKISGIVAMGPEQEIGSRGDLPWRLKEDLLHFKALTIGHPVIMGRKTWESLPKRPLPGRRNIVVSRQGGYEAQGAETYEGIEAAVAACDPDEEPFVIGGAEIYKSALPYLTDLYITDVDMEVKDADTWFPEINSDWTEMDCGDWQESATGIRYRFRRLRRKQ